MDLARKSQRRLWCKSERQRVLMALVVAETDGGVRKKSQGRRNHRIWPKNGKRRMNGALVSVSIVVVVIPSTQWRRDWRRGWRERVEGRQRCWLENLTGNGEGKGCRRWGGRMKTKVKVWRLSLWHWFLNQLAMVSATYRTCAPFLVVEEGRSPAIVVEEEVAGEMGWKGEDAVRVENPSSVALCSPPSRSRSQRISFFSTRGAVYWVWPKCKLLEVP